MFDFSAGKQGLLIIINHAQFCTLVGMGLKGFDKLKAQNRMQDRRATVQYEFKLFYRFTKLFYGYVYKCEVNKLSTVGSDSCSSYTSKTPKDMKGFAWQKNSVLGYIQF